ncbi:Uncharacterized protein TCM_022557 [Theobroma cacao]|uniref:Uncharacterized protein n=1 Tax=Theobroma cacao TaxID=3641 RepID=A0A061ET69_THECC|nr:Uncharacterized protein TCM_022557 [Theobroma cacao]
MRETDVKKINFRTHHGHFKFLTDALSTFQTFMNDVFKQFLHKFALIFFNDLLIYNRTWAKHILHLQIVFTLLRQHCLFLKHSKYLFAQTPISYLRHVISSRGVETNLKRWQQCFNGHNQIPFDHYEASLVSQGKEGNHWTYHDKQIFFKNKVYLPTSSSLLQAIISIIHAQCHEWCQKTLQRVSTDFYWTGMKRQVEDMVKTCEICQRNKSDHLQPTGILQPLPIPTQVWSDISMDFINGLPPSNGKTVLLVVVDHSSKNSHFLPLAHPHSTVTVA